MTRGLRHGRFGRRLSHVSLGKDLGEIRFRCSPRADFKALRCHCTVHGAGVVAGSDFAKFCVCVASAHQIGHLEHLDRPTLMPENSFYCVNYRGRGNTLKHFYNRLNLESRVLLGRHLVGTRKRECFGRFRGNGDFSRTFKMVILT